ncbi:N-acetyltransferase [Vibrio sp. T187]|uniref:GNAT family N-acetyltransferase n=1 Tax=Vibrio TaxID=662 RepID=UPI0010C9E9D4|nr:MULTISPECIES: GNAT family N-acetyltransferase [Vibrio]MBW3696707.1 N-acetyltransferase [Vibrio sp. T187]
MKPQLHGSKVKLRCIEHSDAGDLFEIYSNEATMEFASEPVLESESVLKQKLTEGKEAEESGDLYEWAIECATLGKVVGTCELHSFSLCGRECEIACLVNSSFWRKGYMSEALQLVLEYAQSQGIKKLIADIDSQNYRSIGLFAKNGFKSRGDGKYYLWLEEMAEC